MRRLLVLTSGIVLVVLPRVGLSQVPSAAHFPQVGSQITQNLSYGGLPPSSTSSATAGNNNCGITNINAGYGIAVGAAGGYGYGYGGGFGYGYPSYGPNYDYASIYNQAYQEGYSRGQKNASSSNQDAISQGQSNPFSQSKRGKNAPKPSTKAPQVTNGNVDPATAQRLKGIAQRAESAVRSGQHSFKRFVLGGGGAVRSSCRS